MDGFLGADTDQLLDVGRRVKSAGARCAELADALAAASEGLEWRGSDGDVFRDRVRREAAEALRDAGARLDAGSRALGTQAAQQDAVSDPHGELDDARYAELMGAQGLWSDLTNAGQDL
ncbi:hypothetical protein [Brachybacterium sp. ACRRE]|uniref:hypothetical protein n=1 Tax=Brachybacterium sp. ACRRE TaxID=2918184 RepID=UPI001EF356BF|nr:hypothetical protein [Brachybacterium sp. ACRRE]MCG7308838.1 hypothetical protein [Brachybacterium sp. ACRRE]